MKVNRECTTTVPARMIAPPSDAPLFSTPGTPPPILVARLIYNLYHWKLIPRNRRYDEWVISQFRQSRGFIISDLLIDHHHYRVFSSHRAARDWLRLEPRILVWRKQTIHDIISTSHITTILITHTPPLRHAASCRRSSTDRTRIRDDSISFHYDRYFTQTRAHKYDTPASQFNSIKILTNTRLGQYGHRTIRAALPLKNSSMLELNKSEYI
jgi:hypothetical protein